MPLLAKDQEVRVKFEGSRVGAAIAYGVIPNKRLYLWTLSEFSHLILMGSRSNYSFSPTVAFFCSLISGEI